MNHRHLLPDEIDLLIDDEVGFGVAPLKTHLDECAACRAEVSNAREFVRAIEETPHFAPSHRFADRVMGEVAVLVPWHVAAREFVQGLLPASRPARLVVGAVGMTFATAATLVLVWVFTQTQLPVFAAGVVGDRLRETAVTAGSKLVLAVFGQQAATVFVNAGLGGLALLMGGFFAAMAGALASLRAIAVVAGRRRG